MKTKICVLGIFALVTLAVAEPHTWTFKSGATFAGEYVSSGTNTVFIQHDGRNFFTGISNLVDADVIYINSKENAARQLAFELSLQQADFEKKHLGDDSIYGVKMLSTNRPITITALLATSYDGVPLCDAVQPDQSDSVTNLPGILVGYLPSTVADFLSAEAELDADIDSLLKMGGAGVNKRSIEENQQLLSESTTTTVGQIGEEIVEKQKALAKMHERAAAETTIIAFPSNIYYGGHQIWYCEGLKN